jgi:hypothetical protein
MAGQPSGEALLQQRRLGMLAGLYVHHDLAPPVA